MGAVFFGRSFAVARCLCPFPSGLFDAFPQIFGIAEPLPRSVEWSHVGFHRASRASPPLLSALHLCLFWRSQASPVASHSSPWLYVPTAQKDQAGGFFVL
jgi:hypothetical protein